MAGLKNLQEIKRGDIWATDLRPGTGYEITKIRPTLIISQKSINIESPLVIGIPISSQIPPIIGKDRVIISSKYSGLTKNSVVLCGQIRSIDKARLKKPIGNISKYKLKQVETALRFVVGL